MADTQHQRGCRVWLQDTAQQLLQIRVHIVLATVLIQNDLSSDLRALNCEKFSKGKCCDPCSWILHGYAHIQFISPLT